MASPNISFDAIPSSTRKPGKYFEINTRLAVRTLPGNPQRVLLLGQRLATAASLPCSRWMFSDEQAAQLFGLSSQLHQMVKAAITANPNVQLTALSIDDPKDGTYATGKLRVKNATPSGGVLSVWIGNQRFNLPMEYNQDTSMASALADLLKKQESKLPVQLRLSGQRNRADCPT
jgi:phage tail sheath gpL-like